MSDKAVVGVEFDLGPHGWADVRLSVGESRFDFGPVSYTTDALGDLVRAATMIAAGGQASECLFHLEPDYWRLALTREWAADAPRPTFHVRVFIVEEAREGTPETWAFQERFAAVCATDVFARTVEGTASAVLERHGATGYAESWGKAFPHKALAALRAALATPEPPWTLPD